MSFYVNIKSAISSYKWLFAVLGAMLLVMVAETVKLDVPLSDFAIFPVWVGLSFVQLLIFLGIVYTVGFVVFFKRYPAPLKAGNFLKFLSAWDEKVFAYIRSPRFAQGLIGVVIATMIVAIFTIQKCYIPFLHPYTWDPELAALDKAVSFGRYPHEWLTQIVTATKTAGVLDSVYVLWFPIFYLLTGFALFVEADPRHYMRYMWTFAIALPVIGNYFATWLSSVGPVYFGTFYPDIPDPYSGLLAHLGEVSKITPLVTFDNRQFLVDWVRNDSIVDFNSISAMPSVHVAVMWMLVLYCWKYHWFFRGLSIALFLLIFTGSVYLGFHYAVDGYFSVLLISFFWWFSGRVSKRLCPEAKDMLNKDVVGACSSVG